MCRLPAVGALFAVVLLLSGCSGFANRGVYSGSGWEYVIEEGGRGSVTPPAEGWKPFTPHVPYSAAAPGAVFWLRGSVTLPAGATDPLRLTAGHYNGPCDFWVNGASLARVGRVEPYFFPRYSLKMTDVPPSLLRPGEPNAILIKGYSDSTGFKDLSDPYLFDDRHMGFIQFTEFTSVHMYIGFALVSFVIGLYYLIHFLFNRKVLTELWFALGNLALTVYFYEMGSVLPLPGMALFHGIAKGCMALFFLFLPLFLVSLFDIFNRRPLKIVIAVIQGGMFLLLATSGRDMKTVDDRFLLTLATGGLILLFVLAVSFVALLRKKSFAGVILTGVVIGIVAAAYDIAYSFMGRLPLFWLQGPGILVFDVALFSAQILLHISDRKSLDRNSADLSRQSRELGLYLDRLGDSSLAMTQMSDELGKSLGEVTVILESCGRATGSITGAVDNQFTLVQRASASLGDLLAGSENSRLEIGTRTARMEEAGRVIAGMLEQSRIITRRVTETMEEADRLEELTRSGDRAVKVSREAMEEIQSVSANIHTVVTAMNDLAERTNLLAMNASIEAAHAGAAGRGFAVVAGEIKKLADASSKRSEEVRRELDKIAESIRRGAAVNGEVGSVLSGISGTMTATGERLREALAAVRNQDTVSASVTGAMEELSRLSAFLKEQGDTQETSGRAIESVVEQLVEASRTVREAVDLVKRENTHLTELMSGLRGISARGQEQAEKLKTLLIGGHGT